MPVLLTKHEEFDAWMRGPAQEAMALAREHPPEQMQIVQTSYEKEDALVLGAATGALPVNFSDRPRRLPALCSPGSL
jgi:hypothetical protein